MSTTSWHPQLRHKKTNDRNYILFFLLLKCCRMSKFVFLQRWLPKWDLSADILMCMQFDICWHLVNIVLVAKVLHCIAAVCANPNPWKSDTSQTGLVWGQMLFFFSFISCFTRTKYHKPHLQPPTQFVFFIFSLQRSSVKIRDGGNLN